jgi:hypothetical protein
MNTTGKEGYWPIVQGLRPGLNDGEEPTSFERLLGSSWFAIVHQFITYIKEQLAIAAFTIGKDAQIVSLSRNLVQYLYRLCKESAILLATS